MNLDVDAVAGKALAQPGGIDLDDFLIRFAARAIQLIEQACLGNGSPVCLRQRGKQRQLTPGDLKRLGAVQQLQRTGVKFQRADVDELARNDALAPAQRADPGRKLFHFKGLDEIVVSARIQSHHPVFRLGAGGQKDDRPRVFAVPEISQEVKPALAGQIDVQDDEVATFLFQKHIRFVAVVQDIHRVAGIAQLIGNPLCQADIVFYECDPHFYSFSMKACCKLRREHCQHQVAFTSAESEAAGTHSPRHWEEIMVLKKLARQLALSVTLAAGAFVPAQALAADLDLSGKTVEWVIPFSETGGSAKWANFYAPLLSEALPGQPTVVVKFMPGAGSTKGANWFQNQKFADSEGTVIFGSSGSTQFPYLLGDPRVRYDYKDWNVVLASGTGGVAYLPPDLASKMNGNDAGALKETDFIYGSQGATRLDLVPLLAWEMLGLHVEPVFGIKGRGDGRLMFERGEANIDYQTSSSYLKGVTPLVEAGTAVPMMSWGALDADGNIVRDPTFPDMPTFKEVCEATEGCETSGEKWDAWKAFFIAGFPAQKMVFLPNGASQDAIDTYSKAFDAVKARGDFAEISAGRLGKYPQMTGAEADGALKSATEVPDSAKEFVVGWLQERYGVSLK